MPRLNGIDFIHSWVKKSLVILCTAHEDFALCGYEVSPVDLEEGSVKLQDVELGIPLGGLHAQQKEISLVNASLNFLKNDVLIAIN